MYIYIYIYVYIYIYICIDTSRPLGPVVAAQGTGLRWPHAVIDGVV